MKILLFALAVVASAGTIPVAGTGSFSLDNDFESNAMACFSGTDGLDSVTACANGIPAGYEPPAILWGGQHFAQVMNGWGIINGITSDHFEFSLGGGQDGYIRLMDGANVLASQAISGVLEVTSYEQFGERITAAGLNDGWSARGTFTIGSAAVPEPSTWLGLALGLFVVLMRLAVKTCSRPYRR